MTSLGTTIRIFLASGTPDGLRLVTLSNWPGVVAVTPRSQYPTPEVRNRPEFQRPCVYVLVGPSEGAGLLPRIYVGEGDEARGRLDAHHKTKDFWTQALVFSSEGGALNKAYTRFLEARLLQEATQAKRAELDNGNAPSLPPLSEPDKAEAEAFFQQMLLLLPALRIDAFESADDPSPGIGRLKLSGPKAAGEGKETAEGFLVFAGSKARATTVPSIHGWLLAIRKDLVEQGILEEEGESLVFTQDYLFNAPSAAAGVLLGRSANGRTEWRNNQGKTLKEIGVEAVPPTPS